IRRRASRSPSMSVLMDHLLRKCRDASGKKGRDGWSRPLSGFRASSSRPEDMRFDSEFLRTTVLGAPLLGVWREELLAVDLEAGDQFLRFEGCDPVGELLGALVVDAGMRLGVDRD